MNHNNKKIILNVFFVIVTGLATIIFFVMLYIKVFPLRFMENIAISIKRLNTIGLSVYKSGNYPASEIALNSVIDELIKIKPSAKYNRELYSYYNFELGLAHARLYKTYLSSGKNIEAEKEFQKAVELIGKTNNIKTSDDLIKFVDLLSE